MIARENLYLTADRSRLVDESSPEQAFLLAAKGREIPKWAVEKFGLRSGSVPADGKKASGPSENKAARANEDKKEQKDNGTKTQKQR